MVEHVADAVAVMYRGRIVEQGAAALVFAHPAHPYTQALIEALPDIETIGRPRGPRAVADASEPSPGGCAYAPRCPRAIERCRAEAPALRDLGAGRKAACHVV